MAAVVVAAPFLQLVHLGLLFTLHSFTGADGLEPPAGLPIGSRREFLWHHYVWGGNGNCRDGCGTVFKISAGGLLTTVYDFCVQSKLC